MERSRDDRFCTRDCLPLAGGFDRFRDNGPRRRDGRDNAATELEENRFWASNDRTRDAFLFALDENET